MFQASKTCMSHWVSVSFSAAEKDDHIIYFPNKDTLRMEVLYKQLQALNWKSPLQKTEVGHTT